MATKAEVKSRALELLGVKRIGQSAQTQDDTRIGTAYTEVYADLKNKGIATWAVAGTIPDEIAPHLVSLMAFNTIDDYGVSNARYQRVAGRAGAAERAIKGLVNPDYESLEEPENF